MEGRREGRDGGTEGGGKVKMPKDDGTVVSPLESCCSVGTCSKRP